MFVSLKITLVYLRLSSGVWRHMRAICRNAIYKHIEKMVFCVAYDCNSSSKNQRRYHNFKDHFINFQKIKISKEFELVRYPGPISYVKKITGFVHFFRRYRFPSITWLAALLSFKPGKQFISNGLIQQGCLVLFSRLSGAATVIES